MFTGAAIKGMYLGVIYYKPYIYHILTFCAYLYLNCSTSILSVRDVVSIDFKSLACLWCVLCGTCPGQKDSFCGWYQHIKLIHAIDKTITEIAVICPKFS